MLLDLSFTIFTIWIFSCILVGVRFVICWLAESDKMDSYSYHRECVYDGIWKHVRFNCVLFLMLCVLCFMV